jgi:hypothetical protein
MEGAIDKTRLIWPGLAPLYESIAPYSYALIRFGAGAVIFYHGFAKLFRGLAPARRSRRSGGLRPLCSGPARPEHRPAATSRRSLQAYIASFPLQSSLMSKTYLKSDHFNGGGSPGSASEGTPKKAPVHARPWGQALIIAEQELILRSVGVERIAAFERMRDPNATPFTKTHEPLARAKARMHEAELAYDQFVAAQDVAARNGKAGEVARDPENQLLMPDGAKTDALTGSASASTAAASKSNTPNSDPEALRHEFDAMRLAMIDLNRFERYERRALSRRKRAMGDFIEISSRRND